MKPSISRSAAWLFTTLLLPLLSAFIGSWSTKVPEMLRLLASRIVGN